MSTAKQVRASSSAQEALLAIAEALDRIEEGLGTEHPDEWATWDAEATATFVEAVDVDDLEGLDPGEREVVLEARRQLAKDKPGQYVDHDLPEGEAVTADVTDEEITVEIPPATAAKQYARLTFARQWLKLDEHFKQDGLDLAYAKGGPMWLYLSGPDARTHILSLPISVRQQMVLDVEEDSPKQAYDLGRDLLSARDEEEITSVQSITESHVLGR